MVNSIFKVIGVIFAKAKYKFLPGQEANPAAVFTKETYCFGESGIPGSPETLFLSLSGIAHDMRARHTTFAPHMQFGRGKEGVGKRRKEGE
jgi:hypothetical protein